MWHQAAKWKGCNSESLTKTMQEASRKNRSLDVYYSQQRTCVYSFAALGRRSGSKSIRRVETRLVARQDTYSQNLPLLNFELPLSLSSGALISTISISTAVLVRTSKGWKTDATRRVASSDTKISTSDAASAACKDPGGTHVAFLHELDSSRMLVVHTRNNHSL